MDMDINMLDKFKAGDKVYHKHLEQFGVFVRYSWASDDECYVEFTDSDGYSECKCVSLSQIVG